MKTEAASEAGTEWRTVAMVSPGTRCRAALRGGGGGGNPSIVWDESLGKYVLFHRQLTEKADPETGTGPRYIVRQESEDLVAWSPRQTVFHPMSERWPEVESMKVYRYQGFYLGLPSMLDNYVRGDVEQHLIISRDGFRLGLPVSQPSPHSPRR